MKVAQDTKIGCSDFDCIHSAGDVSWTDMHPVMALCLGFRSRDGKVRQDETVEPLGIV